MFKFDLKKSKVIDGILPSIVFGAYFYTDGEEMASSTYSSTAIWQTQASHYIVVIGTI